MIHRIGIDKAHHHPPLLHEKWWFPQLLDKATSVSVGYPPHWGAGNWPGLHNIQIPAKSNLFCIVCDLVKIWIFETCKLWYRVFLFLFYMGEQGQIKSGAWHELFPALSLTPCTGAIRTWYVLASQMFSSLTPRPTAIHKNRPRFFSTPDILQPSILV